MITNSTPPYTGIIPTIPETFSESWEYVKSDYYRYYGKIPSSLKALYTAIAQPHFGFMFWLRLSTLRGWKKWPGRIMSKRYRDKYGINIFPGTRIGYGFFIAHPAPLVINVSTIIGNNVDIYQFVSIGSANLNAAVIGDNVYIGPNVNIVEHVRVGANSTIGAGAVVLKDVPENATVAGVPAKVISHKQPGRFISNPYPLEWIKK